MGVIYTIGAVFTNLRGGKDMTGGFNLVKRREPSCRISITAFLQAIALCLSIT